MSINSSYTNNVICTCYYALQLEKIAVHKNTSAINSTICIYSQDTAVALYISMLLTCYFQTNNCRYYNCICVPNKTLIVVVQEFDILFTGV